MKVFIVTDGTYSDYHIEAVFSNKEKAEAYCALRGYNDIVAYEVDAGDSGFSSLKEDASECQHYKNKGDVVEVVRCTDCKHRRFSQCPMFFLDYSGVTGDCIEIDNTEDDWYCPCGEKIESEVEK